MVPTLTFECLFAFLVVGHGRRQLLWFAVTRHPTAEWLAQQIVEAFPWDTPPAYLVRDNDGAYGQAFTSRIRTMGIRDRPISPRSPWQNPYVERLIGTLRRDCLDHILIFGEQHLRRVLTSYSLYYNEARTHLGLGKDTPLRTSHPTIRDHHRHAHPVRIASPLRADMIFEKDSRISARRSASIGGRPPRERDFQRQYRQKPARCQRTRVSGRMIVMALSTDGNQRYSWMKNSRSPFVKRTRPRTLRCSTTS